MIRVLVVEDHNLVRQGIRALLEQSGEVEVIGEAATGEEAIQLVPLCRPDIVVMDLAMPRMDGAQAAEKILELHLPLQIIILSMHVDTMMIQQLLRRGVKGYLSKDALTDELMFAIRSVSQGRMYLSPTISDSVMAMLLSPDPAVDKSADLLTPREREVLQLVAEGKTNTAIAETLHISSKTVEKHRANVMTKLEVNDLASLMREGIKQGLILLD